MTAETFDSFWTWRAEDLRRHLGDLKVNAYEGAHDRGDRNRVFHRAFDLLTPVAHAVLADFNAHVLAGTGEITTQPLHERDGIGLYGAWECTWPEQRQARNRFDDTSIPNLQLQVFFPGDFTHGHLMISRPSYQNDPVSCWFMQVLDENDATRQRHALEAICETQVHEMIFLSNWRIIPPS